MLMNDLRSFCSNCAWKNTFLRNHPQFLKMIFLFFENLSFAGVYSGGVTPDPIPNSEVKPASGDGSAVVRLWESSTMPAFFL